MLRPKTKAESPVTTAAREAEEAEPDLSPEGAEVAFARSAEAREHRGKRPPKEGVTTNNDTGWLVIIITLIMLSLLPQLLLQLVISKRT